MLNILLIISLFLIAILHLSLGVFGIVLNRKSIIARFWFFVCLAIFFININFVFSLLTPSKDLSILLNRFIHVGVACVVILYFHFVLLFLLKPIGHFKKILYLGYFMAIIVIIGSFTTFFIRGVSAGFGFDYWVDPGPLYSVILLYVIPFSTGGLYLLWDSYTKSDGLRKKRIFYVLIGTMIAMVGTGTSYLPQTLGIYPFGNFFAWVSPILIFYGVYMDNLSKR